MTRRLPRRERGLETMVVYSLLVHLAVYFLCTRFAFFPGFMKQEAPVYYVDVVNLPVASPQAGSPAGSPAPAAPAPAPAPRKEMTLPARPPEKGKAKAVVAKPVPRNTPQENTREFEERMSQLEKAAGARHEAAALDALKKRVAGSGSTPAGMPGATGKEAGSDYGSYIQSRLKDAFKTTIASQSRNPEVFVRLTIDRRGKVIASRIERSSGDRVFEDAVMRAIAKAEKSFPPPPSGAEFEQGFVFKPQGVGKN